jgi:serine/threonine-protein kinase
VAIKVLHPTFAADAEIRARFLREGRMLCSLRDHHTVTTYELGQTREGALFIVMELLSGRDLRIELDVSKRLPVARAISIIHCIGSALAEAHALGIVHRDLKPANIHLGVNGTVKVLDFGIAKLASGSSLDDGQTLTAMGKVVGTPDYMSPEQLMGMRCDARSDIYALGILLFEMLTGRRPYAERKSLPSLLTAVLAESLPTLASAANTNFPAALESIVHTCLATDPAHRFSSVQALSAALARV